MNTGHNALQIPSQPVMQLSALEFSPAETVNAISFAQLNPQQRTAEIAQWLKTSSHSSFAGSVTFAQTPDTHREVQPSVLVVCENADWQVTVFHSDCHPFATRLEARFPATSLTQIEATRINSLGQLLTVLSTRYDNLCMSTVPLHIEWYQNLDDSALCAVITPDMQAQGGLFAGQRFIGSDFSAQQVARRLGNLSDIHFRDIFTMD